MADGLSPAYQQAVALLSLAYRSIDAEYKSKYRMDLWRQVEGRVRSAANTTATLERWLQEFLRFPHTEIRDAAGLSQILAASPAREVLRIYREEPSVVVALLRADIEAKREEVSA